MCAVNVCAKSSKMNKQILYFNCLIRGLFTDRARAVMMTFALVSAQLETLEVIMQCACTIVPEL